MINIINWLLQPFRKYKSVKIPKRYEDVKDF